MKIRIPVARIVHLLGTLLAAAPGGISRPEAETIARELAGIGLALLRQVAPDEVEVNG